MSKTIIFFANLTATYFALVIYSYLSYSEISPNENIFRAFLLNVCCSAFSLVVANKLRKYPGSKAEAHFLPIVVFSFLVAAAVAGFLRLEYSRVAFFICFLVSLAVMTLELRVWRKLDQKIFAVAPFGFSKELVESAPKKFITLTSPNYDESLYCGLVIDSGVRIPIEWQSLVARALVTGTPVISSINAYESVTGKSPLDYYTGFAYEELQPSSFYMTLRRISEAIVVLMIAPLAVPLVVLVSLLIRLESPGPAIYKQKRTGRGGTEFTMYKLRSMRNDLVGGQAKFAASDDPRVTRIGKLIRRYRIDELPQFFNVLLGDMSIIGPRPEQKTFVDSFEKEIPMYSYRHVVRPGITGWAQVEQGYADDKESTVEKLSYDFYYVKNVGLWLDISIIFRTIRTILTGFGSR